MNMGNRLKTARKFRGFSQEELANKLGVSRGVITNIEGNKVSDPQELVISAICQTLNINKAWLLSGVGEMEISQETQKSNKILAEIYDNVKEFSEEDQRYILDIINSYKNHFK